LRLAGGTLVVAPDEIAGNIFFLTFDVQMGMGAFTLLPKIPSLDIALEDPNKTFAWPLTFSNFLLYIFDNYEIKSKMTASSIVLEDSRTFCVSNGDLLPLGLFVSIPSKQIAAQAQLGGDGVIILLVSADPILRLMTGARELPSVQKRIDENLLAVY
jgi:hypothetical protein